MLSFVCNTFLCSEHVLNRIPRWRGVGTPTPLSASLVRMREARANAGVDPVARLDAQVGTSRMRNWASGRM